MFFLIIFSIREGGRIYLLSPHSIVVSLFVPNNVVGFQILFREVYWVGGRSGLGDRGRGSRASDR